MTVAKRPEYQVLTYEKRLSVMSRLASTYLGKPCYWFNGWELV